MPDRHADHPSTPPATPPHAPPRHWQGLIAALVAVFLIIQFLIPFRFYRDTSTPDERFAWRMFSSVHLTDCNGILYDVVEENGVRVERRVPDDTMSAWKKLLDKGRPDVIDKMMRWRLGQPGVLAVRFVRPCKGPDGSPLPTTRLILESVDGEVRAEEAAP